MNNLEFRRQFLLTPLECEDLINWQTEKIANYFLYVHSDCKLEKASAVNDIFLVGYMLDPHYPQKNSKDIIDELSQEKDINSFPNRLYKLIGRFVLIVKQDNDFIFFNDACGLKTFFYTKIKDEIYAASQPLLINKVLELKKTPAYNEYFNSNYVANTLEHWLPSGVTFYENVFHLVPNHYFRLSENTQKRYWPNKKLQKGKYLDLLNQFSSLLKQIMNTANNHMDLAISLTAGWDSRIVLSSSKDFSQNVVYYTLRYRNMDDKNSDIKIPLSLSRSLNLKHSIFNCQKEITEEFANIYKQNSDMAHIKDWGEIAYGISKTYPQEKVAVRGNCSEIGRCSYYPNGKHKVNISENDFLNYYNKGWEDIDFIKKSVKEWYDEIRRNELNHGYDLYDLFYWEHRMGSWQAQSQLEWDIVQEVFTPFNSRELLDLMLRIETSYRKKYNPLLYKDTMKNLWTEVLLEPINPITLKQKLRKIIVYIIKKIGLFYTLKKLLKIKNY